MSRNFLSVNDVSDSELELLTRPVIERPQGPVLHGAMAFLFEQMSVRTMSSFAAAGIDLGLTPIPLSLRGHAWRDRVDIIDEVRQLSFIARCVVVRASAPLTRLGHPVGLAAVINAGDGSNEHPSQALLDITTMRTFGPIEGKRVALIGNLHQRVSHSLLMALERMGAHVRLVSPPGLEMDARYTSSRTHKLIAHTREDVDSALWDADFIYQTPLAHWDRPDEDPAIVRAFTLHRDRAERVLAPAAKILHPFPRLDELSTDLDGTCFDAYHLQTSMGPAVRRRLLAMLLADDAASAGQAGAHPYAIA